MLIRSSKMVQHHLQERGYRTGFFGKFLNYWDLEEDPPGFDDWSITGNDSYYDATWNVEGTVRDVATYSTTYIGKQGRRFIRDGEAEDDRPWMMILSTSAPHGPQTAEERYEGVPVPAWSGSPATVTQELTGKPDYVTSGRESFGEAAGVREAQMRTLMSVDDMVRKTFAQIRELGEDRNTLALFISDNGMLWGEFGLTGKTHAYTPSIQVPMMIRWPDRVEESKVDRRLVANVDIVPTILDAIGADEVVTDGHSLLGEHRRPHMFLEYFRSRPFATPPWKSIRTTRFQYVEYYDERGEVEFQEYYDLQVDPWQVVNLLADRNDDNDPETARLSRLIQRYEDCSGEGCP